MKESGSCAVRRPFHLDVIERAVVEGLQERLRDRALIEGYVKTYNVDRRRLAAESAGAHTKIEARLTAAERAYDRAYQGYVKGFVSEDEAAVTIPALRTERDAIRAEFAACGRGPTVLRSHPAAVSTYLAAVERLDVALKRDADDGETESREAFRDFVAHVSVFAPEGDQGIRIRVEGRLIALVGAGAFPNSDARG